MTQAKPRQPYIRASEASIGDRGIVAKRTQDQIYRNALADRVMTPRSFGHEALGGGAFDVVIHRALVEISKRRSLTQIERRLRCVTKSRPDAGVSYSTHYRRLARARLAISMEQPR